jgi:hypothetical protein
MDRSGFTKDIEEGMSREELELLHNDPPPMTKAEHRASLQRVREQQKLAGLGELQERSLAHESA